MEINECFKVDISIQDFPPLVDCNKKTIKRIDAGRWYSNWRPCMGGGRSVPICS